MGTEMQLELSSAAHNSVVESFVYVLTRLKMSSLWHFKEEIFITSFSIEYIRGKD